MDDYVNLTSFAHHPFYTEFAIEVEDNWSWDKAYNPSVGRVDASDGLCY